MSAFYNRDSNISGVTAITSLVFNPTYGSRINFKSTYYSYETHNGYYNLIPLSINSLNAEYQLKYQLNESNSQKLINYVENKHGTDLVAFSDPSDFYKTVYGVIDNYSINHVNKNHYEVALAFQVNEAPNLLNWSGMTFVNSILETWKTNQSYEKYDIVYSGVSSNKLDNYYYCSGDHSSSNSSIDGPTGSATKWTKYFFFEPDIGLQNDVALKVDKIEFKNSFVQRMKTRTNIATTDFSYKFEKASTKKAKAILHFLENKGGYRRFYSDPPSVYNKLKVFYSPAWSHTWNYTDSHDIEVTLTEDPLGIVPTGS
jgi:phage-related protein